jgi:hypothetical protein
VEKRPTHQLDTNYMFVPLRSSSGKPPKILTQGPEDGREVSGVPRNFFSGGGSTNSVEDRGQNGDLGAVAP